MAATVNFFNPTDAFGGFTGWEIQTENPNTTSQRAQALKATGDELQSKLYDGKTAVSQTYVASADTAAIPKVGQVKSGYHIDSVSVTFSNTGFVQMTVTGHKHGSATHETCRTYTGSLTALTSKFGCPATAVFGQAGSQGGITIPQGAAIRSMTYTLQLNHVDELDNDGDHLKGENYDGNESLEVELCDAGTVSAAGSWDITSVNGQRGNTAAEAQTVTAEHHLQKDAAGV